MRSSTSAPTGKLSPRKKHWKSSGRKRRTGGWMLRSFGSLCGSRGRAIPSPYEAAPCWLLITRNEASASAFQDQGDLSKGRLAHGSRASLEFPAHVHGNGGSADRLRRPARAAQGASPVRTA